MTLAHLRPLAFARPSPRISAKQRERMICIPNADWRIAGEMQTERDCFRNTKKLANMHAANQISDQQTCANELYFIQKEKGGEQEPTAGIW
jgi:hypothetical protein